MPRYLISFNDGDMDFPRSELGAVGEAAHAVMRDAMDAGVWIVGGGFEGFSPSVVDGEGKVTAGPLAESPVHIGGFTVLEVANREEAMMWAARIAKACRCAQEVRELMVDTEQEELQRRGR